jgi:hypothetical protein
MTNDQLREALTARLANFEGLAKVCDDKIAQLIAENAVNAGHINEIKFALEALEQSAPNG